MFQAIAVLMRDDEMVGALGAATEVSLYFYLCTPQSLYPLLRLSLCLRVRVQPGDVERSEVLGCRRSGDWSTRLKVSARIGSNDSA